MASKSPNDNEAPSSQPISTDLLDSQIANTILVKCVNMASSSNFATRQNALDEVLKLLAECPFQNEPPQEYGHFFTLLYQDYEGRSFRHQYASVYQVILSISDQNESLTPYEVADALSNNLEIIKNRLIGDENTLAKLGMFKLIDHVNLEAQRLARESREQSGQARALRQELFNTRRTQGRLASDQQKLQQVLENQQRDYVTILSVFAAVIIAFGTGTSFAVSITGAVIPFGSVALIAFVICLIGLVLFNSLFALFEFLYRLTRRGRYNMPAGPWGIMSKKTFIGVNCGIGAFVLAFGLLAYFNPAYENEAAPSTQQAQVIGQSMTAEQS